MRGSGSANKPITIDNYEWNHYFDPIDYELYWVLCDRFPARLTPEQMLIALKALDEEENADYTIQDVWLSLDIVLRKYLIQHDRWHYSLKRRRGKRRK